MDPGSTGTVEPDLSQYISSRLHHTIEYASSSCYVPGPPQCRRGVHSLHQQVRIRHCPTKTRGHPRANEADHADPSSGEKSQHQYVNLSTRPCRAFDEISRMRTPSLELSGRQESRCIKTPERPLRGMQCYVNSSRNGTRE